jgi:hypothetical protein
VLCVRVRVRVRVRIRFSVRLCDSAGARSNDWVGVMVMVSFRILEV